MLILRHPLVGLEIRDRSRDILRCVVDVEVLVDGLWDRLDLGAKVTFDIIQVEAIVPVDQVDCKTQMSKASRSSDAMEVGLCVLWEVEIDDNINGLDINAASEEIRANEISTDSITEVMEDPVAVCLKHTSVTVEA